MSDNWLEHAGSDVKTNTTDGFSTLNQKQQALAKLIAAADGLRAAIADYGHVGHDVLTAYDTARAEWEKLK